MIRMLFVNMYWGQHRHFAWWDCNDVLYVVYTNYTCSLRGNHVIFYSIWWHWIFALYIWYGFHSWPNKIKSNKWHQNCFFLKIKMINFEVINVSLYSIMYYTVPLRQQLHVHMYNFVVSQNRRKWGVQVHCGCGWSSLRKQKGIVKSSCILTKWKQTF